MKGLCGADCGICPFQEACQGCESTNGCPFGEQCFVAEHILAGGMDRFVALKQQLIGEFNSLAIDGLDEINELFPLRGSFVNLEYPLPNGQHKAILNDDSIYLGNQVACASGGRCFGLVAGMDFLLVSEYGENGADPEIVLYKRR